MTLRIGISARLLHNPPLGLGLPQKRLQFLESTMAHWIMAHRAIALMVPFVDEESPLSVNRAPMTEIVAMLDGLVLQGGIDICPETYGDTLRDPAWAGDAIRDRYELALLRGFIDAGKPVLGVCRGAQLINVCFGGSLVQDIPSQRPGSINHQDTNRYDRLMHEVEFEPGSTLDALYGSTTPHRVTSIHHQCVDRLGAGLVVEARSPRDGIIEAIRHDGPGYVLGVQWHPEFHLSPGEETEGLLDSGPMMMDFLRSAHARADRHQSGETQVHAGLALPKRA
ncbi:MAG: gamma-glutamyl-gamma-aminobutyrate hydrolase family protein [Hydrogenophaga sp.]|jgi:putative glutamine amidotransferase|uniref:gamma-glutamyl-gamma-aminobutyrate hydrolase family protein n=1 Tax=Hydrogenophaga sp. TaxID=1904254 RepID=UPI002617C139|nr:gamma-glutamyl-gamma-aminobutyrate hydrolase family protein [Hydrogenophaga sp.]MCV0440616.1 gamma-glutamyl-gamma-aminobutyrate hydrolase family protein [Hydrogenophaga sp.]